VLTPDAMRGIFVMFVFGFRSPTQLQTHRNRRLRNPCLPGAELKIRIYFPPRGFREPNRAHAREARCSQALTGRTRCSAQGRCASKRSGSRPNHEPR
jgi:hypothetical protein